MEHFGRFDKRFLKAGDGTPVPAGVWTCKAIKKTFESQSGKLDSLHFAFGDVDAYVIADLPDNESAAAASLAVN